jgi:membrane associated rhomboid family serine protease
MPRNMSMQMGLPSFRGAVRQIIIASTAIYILLLLAISFAQPFAQRIFDFAVLSPQRVLQGWIWQFVTYGFVYTDPLNFAMTMLGIYFLGTAVQEQIGSRNFYGLYFGSLAMAGIAGFLLSLTGVIAFGAAAGAGAATNAILMVFYLLYRGAPIMIFPLPIQIPVKYIVIFTAAIETAYLLLSRFALSFCVLLLGLGAGYVWYKLLYRKQRGRSGSISERLYSMRDAYYRWKRRRAARKFEVYMSKHDRRVFFDEHGNYIPSEEPPKKQNGENKGGWVN